MRTKVFSICLIAGAALIACGDDNGDDTSYDGGYDAGHDAGHDAGTDGGGNIDGGTDGGGNIDGGHDAGNIDSGPATDSGSGDATIASSTGAWVIFPNPYGDGGTNPAAGIQGSAHATRTASGGLDVVLTVSGLPANRAFGAHVHKLACDDMMAGGHYENNPAPPDASTSDPTYANPTNEVWLDFTTDSMGAATANKTETWLPRAGEAKAIVVHDHATGDGGAAGQKLACLNIAF